MSDYGNYPVEEELAPGFRWVGVPDDADEAQPDSQGCPSCGNPIALVLVEYEDSRGVFERLVFRDYIIGPGVAGEFQKMCEDCGIEFGAFDE